MKIGKVTGNVLKRSVLKPITYKREEVVSGAGLGADCAIFQMAPGVYGASCVQEAAVAGKADMGLLISRCVNSLAAAGAYPIAAMLGLVFPETAEEKEIKEYQTWANEACEKLKLQIAGGHTTVSREVAVPFAAVTVYGGLTGNHDAVKEKTSVEGSAGNSSAGDRSGRKSTSGSERKNAGYKPARPAPGQDIVLTKWVGLEGTALLALAHKEALLGRYPYGLVEEACSFLNHHSVLEEARIAGQLAEGAMHDLSEGGVLAALWEFAEGADIGFTVDLKKIPIRQETVEVCEYIGVNPYQLKSGGSLLISTPEGRALVQTLEAAGIPATVIGKVTDGKERLILNEDEVRYLDRPAQDEYFRAAE